jgi:hypothetical protein
LKVYAVYVHDQRYSTPHFYVVTVASDDRVREFARERLSVSEHYRSVEVFDGDRLVCLIRLDGDDDSSALSVSP